MTTMTALAEAGMNSPFFDNCEPWDPKPLENTKKEEGSKTLTLVKKQSLVPEFLQLAQA